MTLAEQLHTRWTNLMIERAKMMLEKELRRYLRNQAIIDGLKPLPQNNR
jgi:hypothetical protein